MNSLVRANPIPAHKKRGSGPPNGNKTIKQFEFNAFREVNA
jgi:hypothetical protein